MGRQQQKKKKKKKKKREMSPFRTPQEAIREVLLDLWKYERLMRRIRESRRDMEERGVCRYCRTKTGKATGYPFIPMCDECITMFAKFREIWRENPIGIELFLRDFEDYKRM
jgi:hypothetical protein